MVQKMPRHFGQNPQKNVSKSLRLPAKSAPLCAIVLATLLAGCSSDVMRFADFDSGSARTQSRSQERYSTPSTPRSTSQGSAGGYGVDPVTTNSLPSVSATQPTSRVASVPTSGLKPDPTPTGSLSQWSVSNGTMVTAGPADTVKSMSYRYGIPENAIRQANGLAAGSEFQAGQKVIIPTYNYGGQKTASVPSSEPVNPPVALRPEKEQSASSAPAKTATKITKPQSVDLEKARTERLAAEKAENEAKKATTSTSQKSLEKTAKKDEPKTKQVAAQTNLNNAQKTTEKPSEKTQKSNKTEAASTTKQDKNDLTEKKLAKKPEDKASETTATTAPVKETKPVRVASLPQANDASPSADAEFRWPVKGRVISQFGSKAGGGANDGINIAVPEGTPVKAAEGGQVIYAGNELKGYGNLVLVRHDNGWVSAYGHNSEVMVRKGDRVVRGQNIARAGQTGDVASPQLHFELRKGSKPVNPLEHLP